MTTSVRQLFRELADTPREERHRILAESQLTANRRAEVMALLEHDCTSGESLARRVSNVAAEAVRSRNEPAAGACGPYRLLRLLGSGGMGTVYLAERRDGEIEHKVAVKLLRADADRPAWRERFLRERQLLANLNHPSIARLLDAGHTADARPYLVMEYVDGATIDEYAAPLELRAKLRLFLLLCEGVSHAHRHLIVHRDLKPSNILVDSAGHPKLLDFGIAKLLDVTGDETRTADRMLTPNYASPEQVRGDVQTTATDIYSLGAVLYKLLTGRSPREQGSEPRLTNDTAIRDGTSTAPSRFYPKLPRDLDHIVRKAMRDEPEERYASVDGLAGDIRAFLDCMPVQARSGDAWYRARKFLRRYSVPASAIAVTIAGLALGLSLANNERALAQQRFQQVRQLANKVLALDTVVGALPGSTGARHEIVAISKQYLEALSASSRNDQELALEIGIAYARLAGVQGVPGARHLGQYAQAADSLHKAELFLEPVLKRSPDNRQAVLALSRISQGLMALGRETGRSNEQVLAHARKAVGYMDRLLDLGTPSETERREGARLFYGIAVAQRNMHLHDDAIHYARRSIELARSLPPGDESVVDGLGLLADLTRISGDLEGALKTIREARTTLQATDFQDERRHRDAWFKVLWREGVILGGGKGLSLNQPGEAIAVLQQAFDVIEDWARSDPNDASSRILFDQAGRELGALLRDREPQRAQKIYDHGLRRLGEVRNNPRARRAQAGLLCGSSYALRRLHRVNEAKQRIDAAFRLLRDTGDYPADRIDTDSEVEPALRALADQLAETGQLSRATEVYQELLNKIRASQPDPAGDLRQATKISRIYEALTDIHRRNHRPRSAKATSNMRSELWQQWNRKLPDNAYIRRELQAAGG